MSTNYNAIFLVTVYAIYPIVSFIYIKKICQQTINNKLLIILIFAVLLNAVFISLLGLYSYGAWWFLMTPICLISPIIGLVGGYNFWIESSAFRSASKASLSIVIVFSFVSSPYLSRGLVALCDEITRSEKYILISAIDQYKKQNGFYPDSLSKLHPEYINELPQATCLKPYNSFGRNYRDHKIEYCEEDDYLLLTVHSTDLRSYLIYNFAYNQWLQAESFDYCGCACPKMNTP